MPDGLSRSEIMAKIPELKGGSFRNYRLAAHLPIIGTRPNATSPHMTENLYPLDSVEKIKAVMPKTEGDE